MSEILDYVFGRSLAPGYSENDAYGETIDSIDAYGSSVQNVTTTLSPALDVELIQQYLNNGLTDYAIYKGKVFCYKMHTDTDLYWRVQHDGASTTLTADTSDFLAADETIYFSTDIYHRHLLLGAKTAAGIVTITRQVKPMAPYRKTTSE